MKKIICVIVFLYSIVIFGQDQFPAQIEGQRISSNFNGSASNGKVLLVYGDGGVILRSPNGGNTWERINLNDSLNIIGIVKIGSLFVGLCSQNYAITSSDDGKSWKTITLNSKSKFYQILNKNGNLYALLDNSIWVMDENLNKIKEYSVFSDSSNKCFNIIKNEIVCNLGGGKLLFINIKDNSQKIINISDLTNCSNCNITSKIISDDNEMLYFGLGIKLYQLNISTFNLDFKINLTSSKGIGLNINNGNVFSISSKTYPWLLDSISFLKIDNITNKYIFIKKSTKDRYITGIYFNELNFISKDTIISVGKNNLITISYDGGINWELKSFLGNYYYLYQFNQNDATAIGSYAQMFSTLNNGTTWLPQENFNEKFTSTYKFKYYLNNNETIHFKDNKNGFIYVNPDYIGDTNVIFTNDGGNKIKLKSIYDFQINNFNTFALNLPNNYLFFSWGDFGKKIGSYTVIHKLDDTLGIIKKSSLKAIQLFYATTWNNNIYAIGYDSIDVKDNYSIFKSMDYGLTWKKEFSFLVDKPFQFNPLEVTIIGDNIFANWESTFYSNNDSSLVQNCFKINLLQKKVTKIFSKNIDGIWKIKLIKDKYYIGSYSYLQKGTEYKLYYTDNVDKDNIEWKIYPSNRFRVPSFLNTLNDSLYPFTIYDSLTNNYALYFSKTKSQTSIESQTEDQNYFYSYPPYPIPAFNEVKSLIYWDMSFDIDASEINVFDVFGNKIDDKSNIKINKLNSYSGYLAWDCSKATSGVYMIQLKHGNKTNNISVMVVR